MERSPVTLFFDRLNLMKPMVKNITFLFKHDFDNLQEFVQSISHTKFNGTIECHGYVIKSEDEHKSLIRTIDADMYDVTNSILEQSMSWLTDVEKADMKANYNLPKSFFVSGIQ
jgi:hypothetical protein